MFLPGKLSTKAVNLFTVFCFIVSMISPHLAFAAGPAQAGLPVYGLPATGQMVPISNNYSFPVLKGLRLDPKNPLHIEFFIDTANEGKVSEEDANRLVRYFLAGLTIPEDQLWVNLSPYEADRISGENISDTDLGKDLLSQDYILKQLTASVTHPDSSIGKDYWKELHSEMAQLSVASKGQISTYNKIWITPDTAKISECQDTAIVTEANLKAMLEQDYLAIQKNQGKSPTPITYNLSPTASISNIATQVMKKAVLPSITQDINTGKNFATLRQIYYSLILAGWFKTKFKDSFWRYYINQANTKGIDLNDKTAKEKIYKLYCQAFSKGLYNVIRKEPANGQNGLTGKTVYRRYFSGGASLIKTAAITEENVDSRVGQQNLPTVGDVQTAEMNLGNQNQMPSTPPASARASFNVDNIIEIGKKWLNERRGVDFKLNIPGSKAYSTDNKGNFSGATFEDAVAYVYNNKGSANYFQKDDKYRVSASITYSPDNDMVAYPEPTIVISWRWLDIPGHAQSWEVEEEGVTLQISPLTLRCLANESSKDILGDYKPSTIPVVYPSYSPMRPGEVLYNSNTGELLLYDGSVASQNKISGPYEQDKLYRLYPVDAIEKQKGKRNESATPAQAGVSTEVKAEAFASGIRTIISELSSFNYDLFVAYTKDLLETGKSFGCVSGGTQRFVFNRVGPNVIMVTDSSGKQTYFKYENGGVTISDQPFADFQTGKASSRNGRDLGPDGKGAPIRKATDGKKDLEEGLILSKDGIQKTPPESAAQAKVIEAKAQALSYAIKVYIDQTNDTPRGGFGFAADFSDNIAAVLRSGTPLFWSLPPVFGPDGIYKISRSGIDELVVRDPEGKNTYFKYANADGKVTQSDQPFADFQPGKASSRNGRDLGPDGKGAPIRKATDGKKDLEEGLILSKDGIQKIPPESAGAIQKIDAGDLNSGISLPVPKKNFLAKSAKATKDAKWLNAQLSYYNEENWQAFFEFFNDGQTFQKIGNYWSGDIKTFYDLEGDPYEDPSTDYSTSIAFSDSKDGRKFEAQSHSHFKNVDPFDGYISESFDDWRTTIYLASPVARLVFLKNLVAQLKNKYNITDLPEDVVQSLYRNTFGLFYFKESFDKIVKISDGVSLGFKRKEGKHDISVAITTTQKGGAVSGVKKTSTETIEFIVSPSYYGKIPEASSSPKKSSGAADKGAPIRKATDGKKDLEEGLILSKDGIQKTPPESAAQAKVIEAKAQALSYAIKVYIDQTNDTPRGGFGFAADFSDNIAAVLRSGTPLFWSLPPVFGPDGIYKISRSGIDELVVRDPEGKNTYFKYANADGKVTQSDQPFADFQPGKALSRKTNNLGPDGKGAPIRKATGGKTGLAEQLSLSRDEIQKNHPESANAAIEGRRDFMKKIAGGAAAVAVAPFLTKIFNTDAAKIASLPGYFSDQYNDCSSYGTVPSTVDIWSLKDIQVHIQRAYSSAVSTGIPWEIRLLPDGVSPDYDTGLLKTPFTYTAASTDDIEALSPVIPLSSFDNISGLTTHPKIVQISIHYDNVWGTILGASMPQTLAQTTWIEGTTSTGVKVKIPLNAPKPVRSFSGITVNKTLKGRVSQDGILKVYTVDGKLVETLDVSKNKDIIIKFKTDGKYIMHLIPKKTSGQGLSDASGATGAVAGTTYAGKSRAGIKEGGYLSNAKDDGATGREARDFVLNANGGTPQTAPESTEQRQKKIQAQIVENAAVILNRAVDGWRFSSEKWYDQVEITHADKDISEPGGFIKHSGTNDPTGQKPDDAGTLYAYQLGNNADIAKVIADIEATVPTITHNKPDWEAAKEEVLRLVAGNNHGVVETSSAALNMAEVAVKATGGKGAETLVAADGNDEFTPDRPPTFVKPNAVDGGIALMNIPIEVSSKLLPMELPDIKPEFFSTLHFSLVFGKLTTLAMALAR